MTLRRRATPRRRAVLALWVMLCSLAVAAPASAVPHPARPRAEGEAEAELAAKYHPLITIRQHLETCGPGEAFLPSDALDVIGQPEVVLRDGAGNELTTAPTAADLAAAPDDGTIDFPGNPLEEGLSLIHI